MTIDDLMQQIEETERLVAVYRNANEVIVGTQDEIYSRRGLINRTTLTAAEIGSLGQSPRSASLRRTGPWHEPSAISGAATRGGISGRTHS
jgi:hypothetical protein